MHSTKAKRLPLVGLSLLLLWPWVCHGQKVDMAQADESETRQGVYAHPLIKLLDGDDGIDLRSSPDPIPEHRRLILIYYRPQVDPETFKATLNGRDVTDYFHPGESDLGHLEGVKLPFEYGENKLEIKVGERREGTETPFPDELMQHYQLTVVFAPLLPSVKVESYVTNKKDDRFEDLEAFWEAYEEEMRRTGKPPKLKDLFEGEQ